MTIHGTLKLAAALVICVAVGVQSALASARQTNVGPFTRAVAAHSSKSIALAGEAKNSWPFTRAVVATHALALTPAGEPKNLMPFIRALNH
jgi:hypothetical protein